MKRKRSRRFWRRMCVSMASLMVVRRIREAYFYMPADMPWSLDGERADTGRVVHVCNLPNAYRMMLPKK